MLELNETTWKEEAEAVLADIKDHVKSVSLSTQLPSNCKRIYFNVTTLEEKNYCIELTAHGFRIVGNCYDCTERTDGETFETPYSLLDSISPKYRNSFGRSLEVKLKRLKEDEMNEKS